MSAWLVIAPEDRARVAAEMQAGRPNRSSRPVEDMPPPVVRPGGGAREAVAS